MPLYRYSRWDGTQDLFPIGEDDLLDQLSDQVMAHGDSSAALRSVIQHGASGKSGQRLPGILDILQRLQSLRHQTLERYNLSEESPVAEDKLR